MRVSVLLPTRGRTDALLRSVQNLLGRASEPEAIEILLAMDHDDTESMAYARDHIQSLYPDNIHIYQMQPLGYTRLSVYYNTLAGLAWGHWLLMWNDDALIDTDGWDLVLDRYVEHPMPLLRMPCSNFEHPFALFPIIKKEWFNVCANLSYYAHIDRFLYNVAQNICGGIIVDIPVTVTHDRADITGNNQDLTFEKSYQSHDKGNPNDPFSDEYPVAFQAVMHMVNRLRQHINQKYGYEIPLTDLTKPMKLHHTIAQSHNHTGTQK